MRALKAHPAPAPSWRAESARGRSPAVLSPLIVIFGICLLCLASHPARAAAFKLLQGGRYELCRAFAENLKSHPDLSGTTEEWPLDPRLKGFTKPKWEILDAREHLDTMKKLFFWNWGPGRQVGSDTPEEIWERHAKDVFDALAKGTARLERARFDFDNDGHIDTVYRFYNQLPGWMRSTWRTRQAGGYWYIYSSDDSQVAERFRRNSEPDMFYDSFLFKGRSYLMGWLEILYIYELQTIPTLHELAVIDVCRFEVRP